MGTLRAATEHTRSRPALWASRTELILPIVVLLVAIFLRLYSLDTIPRGLLYDEAYNGADALRILEGERPIFLTGNFGREALFVYLQAISIAIVGQTVLSLRIVSAVLGILTIVAAYVLVRRMFDARIALLASGWLTVSLWHIIFSRTGLRSVSLPLFLAVGFYCLWRGLEGVRAQGASPTRSIAAGRQPPPAIWFALGGIVIGLSLYTYSTARFAPLFILALALYLVLFHRHLFRKALLGLVLALGLATVVFLPQGVFFLNQPESFMERALDVSPLNPELNQGNPAKAVFESAVRTLGMFAIRGDSYVDRNIPGRPIFDPVSASLMLLGLGLLVWRFRQPAYGFIGIWLFLMFVPSLVAIKDTPNYLRITGLVPALFILPALGAAYLWQAWKSHAPAMVRQMPIVLLIAAFLGGSLHAFQSYFVLWPRLPEYSRVFSTDKFVTLEAAIRIVRADQEPIFVATSDHDDPWVHFTLSSHPEAEYIRSFYYVRSMIFPSDHLSPRYLFTPDLPEASILNRYFDESSVQFIETTPSGNPITSRTLLGPRPPFEPRLVVPARFGDHILVDGFDLPKDARAGGILTVRWYWRLLATDEREFAFTNQLFAQGEPLRGQYDARAFAPGYWPAGTSGITTFEIDIDPETPTGAYWLRVAVYDRNKRDISNLPVFDTNGNQAGNHLRLGPIKVHGQTEAHLHAGPASSPPKLDNQLLVRFEDQIDLQGYSLGSDRLLPGESLDLTLFWSPRGRPKRDYTVFIHLLDPEGQLQGQTDSAPTSGKYPASVWDAGEFIADAHTIALPAELPAGEYSFAIGLYDPLTGQRLPILDETGQPSGDHVTIPGLIVESD